MHPARGAVPVGTLPFGVLAIAAIDVASFGYALTLEPGEQAAWLDRWGLVPREFLRGAATPSPTRQVTWLTPVTSMFLHGNLLHLAGNLLYLWVFGRGLESMLGRLRFAGFYLVCGLAAAGVHVAIDPTSFVSTVGASGAISGLLGAWVVCDSSRRLGPLWPPKRAPAYLLLGLWVAIQLVSALLGATGVVWWAHLAGFVTGALLARSLSHRGPMGSRVRI